MYCLQGPVSKRGKIGKSSKKDVQSFTQPETDQPSTSAQDIYETALPSTSTQTLPLKKPSKTIVKKCEEIEKLAASIQQKCKITPHKHEQFEEEGPENVQELEYLVSEIKKLAQNVGFDMPSPPPLPPAPRPNEPIEPIAFYENYRYKWPKTKTGVPYIFLHPPIDLRYHARDVLSKDIKMYWPERSQHYTKILCETFEDHQKLTKYFDEKEMPYHTFSHPSEKFMKVVIRGISNDVDLNKVKDAMIAASIPVERFHKMNAKVENCKSKYTTILVVVPENDEGRKLLKVKSIFGNMVYVEPPLPKSKQCYRCQKWGHSQRYCRGRIKCVKCAGEHLSSECKRDPEQEPAKCANCDGEHTASFRKCPHCPDSKEYKEGNHNKTKLKRPRKLLTLENCPRSIP